MRLKLNDFLVLIFSIMVIVSSVPSAIADESLAKLSKSHWQEIPGSALEIRSTSDGVVYSLGYNQRVYRWRSDRGWLLLPGEFTALVIDNANKPWAIDTSGNARRFNGLWWDEKKTEGVTPYLLSASALDSSVYALSTDNKIYKWDEKKDTWLLTDFHLPEDIVAVSFLVDSKEEVWFVSKNNELYHYGSGQWKNEKSGVARILETSDGVSVAAHSDGKFSVFSEENNYEFEIPNTVISASFSQNNALWFINKKRVIYTTSSPIVNDPIEEADVIPVPIANKKENAEKSNSIKQAEAFFISQGVSGVPWPEIDFVKVNGAKLHDIEIGVDGSVYGITKDSQIVRWNNRSKEFLNFPGIAKRIAVDTMDRVWVINPINEVFRLEGKNWKRIQNITADEITASLQGEIYVISPAGNVSRFNTVTTRFESISRLSAKDIDVDRNGNVFLLSKDGKILDCSSSSCQVIKAPTAKGFDIGPSGSFFIITERNLLYRYDLGKKEWSLVKRNVEQVSVGPSGYPWIIDKDDNVFYSALFERDESNDRKFALQIRGNTLNIDSGNQGITISRSLRFTQVALPSGANANLSLVNMQNGTVYLIEKTATSNSENSSNSQVTTYANATCLSDELNNFCRFPDSCPSTADPACIPCDVVNNQQQPTSCVAITENASNVIGSWVNALCIGSSPGSSCLFGGQGQPGGPGSSVDCNLTSNQTSTVCVQYGNSVVASNSNSKISKLWRYDEISKRFRLVRNFPNNIISLSSNNEGKLWLLTEDEELLQETSFNSGRYKKITNLIRGDGYTNPLITAGDNTLYIINSSEKLFVIDDSDPILLDSKVSDISLASTDNNGRLWAVANGRVVFKDDENFTIVTQVTANPLVALINTVAGDIFTVLDKSIYRVNRTTGRLEKVNGNYSDARSIASDKKGKLWVISKDNLLYKQN